MADNGDILDDVTRRRGKPERIGQADMRLHRLRRIGLVRDLDDLVDIDLHLLDDSERPIGVDRTAPGEKSSMKFIETAAA
jgi:hypothetical protein